MTCLSTEQLIIRIGSKTLCHSLTFSINPGETWGVLGPNGSGKTTLLHTLAGLKQPFAGKIHYQSQSLNSFTPQTIAQKRAVLLQDTHFTFPQTVWEYCLAARYPHISYFKKETPYDYSIAQEALQIVELDDMKQKSTSHLSGGEKRRLAIAAALTQTPNIFLLDEPTNHLDIKHQLRILTHFNQLAKIKNIAFIMTLHDINLAQQFCSHHLLLLPDGSFIKGDTESVLTEENLNRLYQTSIKKISYDNKIFWYLATNPETTFS